MSLPIYQRVAVTDAGDIIPGAEYTVINENTGVAAPIYSDRTGATLLTAPYFADSAGTIQFFIAQGTTFRVAASGGVGTYTDRYVYGVADAVLVQPNGNVGIGITGSKKLTVFGTGVGNATIQIEGEGGADPYINFLTNNAQHWSMGVDDSDADKFKISEHSALGTNDYLAVDVTGNVGIGTSSLSDKLTLSNGQMRMSDDFGIRWGDASAGIYGSGAAENLRLITSGSERVRIDSSGNLLVGTTSSPASFASNGHAFVGASGTSGVAPVAAYNSQGTANCPVFNVLSRDASTDSSNRFMQFYSNVTLSTGTAMGGIVGNGTSNVQFAALSDVREKQNITSLSGSLSKINRLNPVEFDWIASGEHCEGGFVAQEVEEIFPEYVIQNISNGDDEERKGITGGMTAGFVSHLVKAIQEQQTLIEALTARIEALEG